MAKFIGGRKGFRAWVDKHSPSDSRILPLTHITRGIGADDIVECGVIKVDKDFVFDQSVAYLFYGKPAYRLNDKDIVKLEAACPFCFIFKAELINKAKAIFAFDTGAFAKRLYSHILTDEMDIEDFLLEKDISRPNKLISATFGDAIRYIDGRFPASFSVETTAEAWEHHARAYLHLITSFGRNEPDDRIHSIEIIFSEDIKIENNLLALVVPHTHWGDDKKAPWLSSLHAKGVDILTYDFVPGKHPEHYHSLVEASVKDFYKIKGII
ncbi:hypothetical protein [Methylobacterium indicum]|uniref:hypothetical protein n=1 Tax=Methylobacterium indicum TaxID=1775910 RepID=UPI000F7A741E|nr:hypothetical protein [Methylobacterium indicum]